MGSTADGTIPTTSSPAICAAHAKETTTTLTLTSLETTNASTLTSAPVTHGVMAAHGMKEAKTTVATTTLTISRPPKCAALAMVDQLTSNLAPTTDGILQETQPETTATGTPTTQVDADSTTPGTSRQTTCAALARPTAETPNMMDVTGVVMIAHGTLATNSGADPMTMMTLLPQ